MSIVMKNKLSATALAIATVMGMGYSAMASAESTTFTTTINVHSDNVCEIDTVQPASANFAATWTKTAGQDASTLVVDSAADPVFIGVNVKNGMGANCQLNRVRIGTEVTGTAEAAATTGAQSAAWLQTFGSAGGHWRFAPSLAQLKLFTSNDYLGANAVTATDITVKDALGTDHAQLATAHVNGGVKIAGADIDAMGAQADAYVLTDGFFGGAGGFVPMAAKGGAAMTYSLTGGAATDSIKSMQVGVGGIIGGDPEDGAGAVDRTAAAEGDAATLTWVTTVSLA